MHPPKSEHLKKKPNREVRIPSHLLMSKAFMDLSRTSMVVLMLFLEKRSWHYEKKGKIKGKPIYNNKGHKFPYSEASEYGIGKCQFRRSIKELIEHGFLTIEKQGGQFLGHRECSVYSIIDDWMLYGTIRFSPRPVPRAPCFSRGFRDYNEERKKAKAEKIRQSIPTTDHSLPMATEATA